MKRRPKSLLCAPSIAGAVLISATLAEANSYIQTIASKNVFRLISPPKAPQVMLVEPATPGIKLQAITTILGQRQVAFRVQVPAGPGTGARDYCLVLNEGESAEGIEVRAIDEKAGVVKFLIQGKAQILTLKNDADKRVASPVAPAPVASVPPPPFPPRR